MEFLTVVFYVSLNKAKDLKLGQNLEVTFEHPRKKVLGQIEFIDPVAESASATVKINIVVPNQDGLLKGGVLCRIVLE